jgi:plasmid stabilization system protein ParE
MRVRYTLRARADLDAIYTALDQQNPMAAQVIKDLLEGRIVHIRDTRRKQWRGE